MKITTQVTDVQLKTYEEATLLSLDPTEIEDLPPPFLGRPPSFDELPAKCRRSSSASSFVSRLSALTKCSLACWTTQEKTLRS